MVHLKSFTLDRSCTKFKLRHTE